MSTRCTGLGPPGSNAAPQRLKIRKKDHEPATISPAGWAPASPYSRRMTHVTRRARARRPEAPPRRRMPEGPAFLADEPDGGAHWPGERWRPRPQGSWSRGPETDDRAWAFPLGLAAPLADRESRWRGHSTRDHGRSWFFPRPPITEPAAL